MTFNQKKINNVNALISSRGRAYFILGFVGEGLPKFHSALINFAYSIYIVVGSSLAHTPSNSILRFT